MESADRKQLHLPVEVAAQTAPSWFNQTINAFLESYLATLIKGCVFNAKRIHATVLVPLSQNLSSNTVNTSNEYAVYRFSIDSIEVSTSLLKEEVFSEQANGLRGDVDDSQVVRLSKRCRDGSSAKSGASAATASAEGASTRSSMADGSDHGPSSTDGDKVMFAKGINVRGVMCSLAKVDPVVFNMHTDYENLLPSKLKESKHRPSHHRHHHGPHHHHHGSHTRSGSSSGGGSSGQVGQVDQLHMSGYHILLNPTHIFVHSSLCSVRGVGEPAEVQPYEDLPGGAAAAVSSASSAAPPDTLLLDVSVEINNLEITPSIIELRMLRDVSKTAAAVGLRKKFEFYRPSVGIMGHASEWWLYVILSATKLIRESRRLVEQECQAGLLSTKTAEAAVSQAQNQDLDLAHRGVLRKVFRAKYIKLYRRAVLFKFDALFAALDDLASGSNAISGSFALNRLPATHDLVVAGKKKCREFLSPDDQLLMNDAERVMRASDLISCRAAIQKAIQETGGVSADAMKLVVCGELAFGFSVDMLQEAVELVCTKREVELNVPEEEDVAVPPTPNFSSLAGMPSAVLTPFAEPIAEGDEDVEEEAAVDPTPMGKPPWSVPVKFIAVRVP